MTPKLMAKPLAEMLAFALLKMLKSMATPLVKILAQVLSMMPN